MWIRAILVAALLTWAATACTSGGGAPAKPSASPPGQVIGTTTTKPLTFGAEPLWTDQTKGAPHSAARFALHDDSVVMFNGPKGGEAFRLSVEDAATGKTRWSLPMLRPLPGGHGDEWNGAGADETAPVVVDRGGDWGVLIATTRRSDTRQKPYGLALLDGEDGHVLWRQKIIDADVKPAHDRYLYPSRVLADDARAVVILHPSYGGTGKEFRLATVDARTGKRLWTRTGVMPNAVVSGSVVGVELPALPIVDDAGAGTVTVLDAATGRTRWSRPTGALGRVAALAGDVLLLREQHGGTPAGPVVLDLAKGTELGRMPAQISTCVDDRTTLIACEALSPEPRLFTMGAGDRKVRVSAHSPPGGMVITLVRDGRIYYNDVHLPGQELDRAATPLAGRMPEGFLLALSDRYAVIGEPAIQSYQVYRVD